MKALQKIAFMGFGAAALLLSSCAEPINDVQFKDENREFAVPLVSSKFTLKEVLTDTSYTKYITQDPSGGFVVRYNKQVLDQAPGALIKMPNIVLPLASTNSEYDLSAVDMDFEVRKMSATQGKMVIELKNPDPVSAVTARITSENFRFPDNLDKTYTIQPGESIVDSFSVVGMDMIIPSSNKLVFNYDVQTSGANPNPFVGGKFTLKDLDYSYAEGIVNKFEFELQSDSIEIDILDRFKVGSIGLVNPAVNIQFNNEVGIPFNLKSNKSYGITRDGEEVQINSVLNDGFTVAYPSVSEGKVAKQSDLLIDSKTSNIVSVLNQLPKALVFDLNVGIGSDQVGSLVQVYKDARFKANMQVDLPLALKFNDFEIPQEFEFSPEGLDDLVAAKFYVDVENGFGLETNLQVYLYNKDKVLIDSLINGQGAKVASADVDAQGNLVKGVMSNIELDVPKEKIQSLRQTTMCKAVIRLNSPVSSGLTKLDFANYASLKMKADLTTNPLKK